MIKNKDRSKWFGASDTHYIMGNWNTKTFQNWWMQKLGLIKKDFNTIYTIAGNEYEHKIAETIRTYFDDDKFKLDRQIKCRKWRVRVNLDCESKHTIYDMESSDTLVFTSPMVESEVKGATKIQNLGAVETYQRRYLYMTAFEIM